MTHDLVKKAFLEGLDCGLTRVSNIVVPEDEWRNSQAFLMVQIRNLQHAIILQEALDRAIMEVDNDNLLQVACASALESQLQDVRKHLEGLIDKVK